MEAKRYDVFIGESFEKINKKGVTLVLIQPIEGTTKHLSPTE